MRHLETLLGGEYRVCVIGLGYVGLPLALEVAKYFDCCGFDVDEKRISELKNFSDSTGEVPATSLLESSLTYTNDASELDQFNFFIIAVPTPIDIFKVPDLSNLYSACSLIAPYCHSGLHVVFESTVYPGVTRGILAEYLSSKSGSVFNKDFFLGYSPERINPGDRHHKITDVIKVVSGSTPSAAEVINNMYRKIIGAGTYLTQNIEIAEGAKVIENIQRDVNIALMNELSIIFNKLGISFDDVLSAAKTKWNFLDFRPGLVGGHCIGIDPYYLMHAAQTVGYEPTLIRSARIVNESMVSEVVGRIARILLSDQCSVAVEGHKPRVAILGLSFKSNVSDLRNSKSVELTKELGRLSIDLEVIDPVVSPLEGQKAIGFPLTKNLSGSYDCIVLAVAHECFKAILAKNVLGKFLSETGTVFDIQGVVSGEFKIEEI